MILALIERLEKADFRVSTAYFLVKILQKQRPKYCHQICTPSAQLFVALKSQKKPQKYNTKSFLKMDL